MGLLGGCPGVLTRAIQDLRLRYPGVSPSTDTFMQVLPLQLESGFTDSRQLPRARRWVKALDNFTVSLH